MSNKIRFSKKYDFNVEDLAGISGATSGKKTKINNQYVDMKALAALGTDKPVYRVGDKNDVSAEAVYQELHSEDDE